MSQKTTAKATEQDQVFYRDLLMGAGEALPARHGRPVGVEYDDYRAAIALNGDELVKRTKPLLDWARKESLANPALAEKIQEMVRRKEGVEALAAISTWTQHLDPEKESHNEPILGRRLIELLAWANWKLRNYVIPYEGVIEDTDTAEQVVTSSSEAIWLCLAFLKNKPDLKNEIIRHFLANIWSQHVHYALYTKRLTEQQSQEGLRVFKTEVIDHALEKFRDGVRLTPNPAGTPERLKLEKHYLQYAFLMFYGRSSKTAEIGWERYETLHLEQYLNDIFVRGRTKLRITEEMKADYKRLVETGIIVNF